MLCASAMALIRRPTEARGVLTELQEMGNRGDMSQPLAAIFGDAAKPTATQSAGGAVQGARPILSGAELSHAQGRVLRRAGQRPPSPGVGPPRRRQPLPPPPTNPPCLARRP